MIPPLQSFLIMTQRMIAIDSYEMAAVGVDGGDESRGSCIQSSIFLPGVIETRLFIY